MVAKRHEQAWRMHLTRDLGWSLLLKLGLLTLLWALFFSSSHRCRVDGPATASRLALEAERPQLHEQTITTGEARCD
jgi:hypothetical protein